MNKKQDLVLSISPNFYKQSDFDSNFQYTLKLSEISEVNENKKPDCIKLKSCQSITTSVKNLFPIITWLTNYKTSFLVPDIVAGVTVAIVQVPECMGYALLAHLAPVYGLYSALFPSMMYAIFGTAKHSSVGAVAAVAIMTGGIIKQVQEDTNNHLLIEIAATVGLITGIYQLILGLLRFGFVSCYMSEHLITGFTSAVAFHVLTSQIEHMFGVSVDSQNGPLALFYIYQDLIHKVLKHTNFAELIISIVCLVILLLFKLYLNNVIKAKLKIQVPFPAEILVLIGVTIVSNIFELNKNYGVKIIGPIPRGLPEPSLPSLDIVPLIWTKCIPLAVVCFTLCYSIGKTFGNKHRYSIDASQEMVAIGACNIFGSVWTCIPSSTSLSRSAVCEGSGGKTQVVALVNGTVILAVLFWLGAYLQKLPKAVLASIVAVALRHLLLSVTKFKKYWDTNKLDASIWLVTFSSVLIVDMDIGLYIGIIYSLVTLIYKSQRPKMYLLGRISDNVWVPLSNNVNVKEVPGVKVYQFCGPLHFANTEYFKNGLNKTLQFSVKKIKKVMKQMKKSSLKTINSQMDLCNNLLQHPTHVIIDCSMFSYIDSAGIKALKEVIEEYRSVHVKTLLAGCPTHVTKLLEQSDCFYSAISSKHVFASIQDAADYAVSQRNKLTGGNSDKFCPTNIKISIR